MRRSSSDALQDMVGGDELSLYGSAPNNTESAQVLYNGLCEHYRVLIILSVTGLLFLACINNLKLTC